MKLKSILTITFSLICVLNYAQQPNLIYSPTSYVKFNVTNTASNISLNKSVSAPVNINDTLLYFALKHFYKNTNNNTGYFFVNSPQPNSTSITEFGSAFINGTSLSNGDSVQIKGCYFLAAKSPASTNTSIPIRVYLYSATPLGLPLNLLDSTMAVITSTNGSYIAANFAQPKTITGSFFMSYRPMGTGTDTVRAYMNNAATPSNTSVPINQRFGEGLSYLRLNGAMTPMANVFGTGTDYEWIIAPIVSFNYSASTTFSGTQNSSNSFCSGLPLTFNNTCTRTQILENRQFNGNRFYTYWAPFSNTVFPPNLPDSIYTWYLNGAGTSNQQFFSKNLTHTFPSAGQGNYILVVRYRGAFNVQTDYSQSLSGTLNVAVCNVNVDKNYISDTHIMYPNPAKNSITLEVSNLSNANELLITNLIGQICLSKTDVSENDKIDISSLSAGVYFVTVTNGKQKATQKLVIEK